MIPLEGKALHGLDEFMLRLGHLKLICNVAVVASGNSRRFERELADKLTKFIEVPLKQESEVARYLHIKRLAPDANNNGPSSNKEFKYPDLKVYTKEDGSFGLISAQEKQLVMWQDLCLSDGRVPSKVGAITVSGKRGSKTGLSHLIDWSAMLELTNLSGVPSARGQLLGLFRPKVSESEVNPYIIGFEKLLLGDSIVRADADLFVLLIEKLFAAKSPIKKKDAIKLYIEAVQEVTDRAESARNLSNRDRQNLFTLWRDLPKNRDKEPEPGSTAWHRAASRFESYVDLGFLEKGKNSETEKYEYKYYVSEHVQRAKETLEFAKNFDEWASNSLGDALLNTNCSKLSLAPAELIPDLPELASTLTRSASPLPIDSLTVGLMWLRAAKEQPISYGAAQKSFERLATERPDLARLSTGSHKRPEYLSLNIRALKQ